VQVGDIFQEYEDLVKQVDNLFIRVKSGFPDEIRCAKGCSDCCYALFDLSLIEAVYLNRAFLDNFDFGAARSAILDAAAQADRTATRHKRDFYNMTKQGTSDEEILALASKVRIRCPLLGFDNSCRLYAHRPITCRLYGVPNTIQGKSYVCGLCTFKPGQSYPTFAQDRIQDKLADFSRRLAQTLDSRFSQLGAVYVPVSMALITRYDDNYLGVGKSEEQA